MRPTIYWIETPEPRRLAVMPRPRGGDWLEAELKGLRSDGVDVLVSLLEPHEVAELDLAAEAPLCAASGLEFLSHPIPDRGVPGSLEKMLDFIRDLDRRIRGGKRVAVHCRAGIGRSGLVAAGVLMLQGLPLVEILKRLENARGLPMPETPDQRRWLERLIVQHPPIVGPTGASGKF
jgi:protein-tyrosine phosphatase